MVNITTEQMDAACAAYARAIGYYPNRAGVRAALHTVETPSLALDERALLDRLAEGLSGRRGEEGAASIVLRRLLRQL